MCHFYPLMSHIVVCYVKTEGNNLDLWKSTNYCLTVDSGRFILFHYSLCHIESACHETRTVDTNALWNFDLGRLLQ